MTAVKKKQTKKTFAVRIVWYVLPWMTAIILIVAGIFFYIQYRTFKADKEESVAALISERAVHFDEKFTEIRTDLVYVSGMPSVINALLHYDEMSFYDQYMVNNEIQDAIGNLNIFNTYIEDIVIIGKNGFLKNLDSYDNIKVRTDPFEWESIKQYNLDSNRNIYYTLPYIADYYSTRGEHMVISVVLAVKNNGQLLGYIQCNLNYDKLLKMLRTDQENVSSESHFTAVDEAGRIVISEDVESIGASVPEAYTGQISGDRGFFTVTDGDRRMAVYRKLELTHWTFLETVSYSEILKPLYTELFLLLVFILPISIAIMAVVILILARKIQQPLRLFAERIEEVDIENYTRSDMEYNVKEIDVVADKFELAMTRIRSLVLNVYQEELMRKNAQLEVLRNQITPHFLYNSLQLIKAEAVMSGNREISKSVTSLANLLRYSMDSGSVSTTVGAELDYINDFLTIYKKRYMGKFDFSIEAGDGMRDRCIPKMILQPLVENSLKHGLVNVKNGGMIEVKGYLEDGRCCFTVRDNGCGMDPESLEHLRRELDEDAVVNPMGIGVVNVHQRVRIQCGEGCGIMSVDSKQGEFFSQTLVVRELESKGKE